MKSFVVPDERRSVLQRVDQLDRKGAASALPELIELSHLPSETIKCRVVSAIGKLAGLGANSAEAMKALSPLARDARSPKTQTHAVRAMRAYVMPGQR